ncbi:MAG TPA: DUF2254 domain-containing protein [Phycisphaerales bacterium]|nr:DUF2254 domain-containing protein [Phycisphaerales bacterium]
MTRLLNFWQELRASLWFVPVAMVLMAVTLAIALIEMDARIDPKFFDAWPRLFGAGAAGSRGMLATVAGSMITVAGVVFSITLVALSLASSQYSSRVLRNFMTDRTNQTVLGVFVGIFAYCLVVLRTIREGETTEFVPSLAVVGGVVLAFVGMGFFIYFIHHIAMLIQASQILARIAAETISRVDHLFPEGVGDQGDRDGGPNAVNLDPECAWNPVPAQRTGYIQHVDDEALFASARECKAVIRMEHPIGDFVIEGMPIASVYAVATPNAEVIEGLAAAYTINQQRTTDQDAAYGIRQIVDVALKALSPGINDTTTAVMSLDYLTAILVRVSGRRIESPWRYEAGALRVITRGATFAGLLELSLDQIRQNASGNVAVLNRLLGTLELLESLTRSPARRQVLRRQARALEEAVQRTIPGPLDREPLEARSERLVASLAPPESRN